MGFAVMVSGILTYALGILKLAPQQKFKVMKIVKRSMADDAAKWYSDKYEQQITSMSPLAPGTRKRDEPKNFEALMPDEEGCRWFKEGLYHWDMVANWDYAETKNLFNCCEIKHGVPFLRLARLGFMSAPTPKDLGGILNANALYTFCTGIFQLCVGAFILADTPMSDWTLFMMLPLGVSFLSFVLSVANMLLDFSGILTALENEQQVTSKIEQKNEIERVKKRKDVDNRYAEQEKRILERYTDLDHVTLYEKQKSLQDTQSRHATEVDNIEEALLQSLVDELRAYRERMDNHKREKQGKSNKKKNLRLDGLPLQSFKHKVEAREQQIRNLEEGRDKKIQDVLAKEDQMT